MDLSSSGRPSLIPASAGLHDSLLVPHPSSLSTASSFNRTIHLRDSCIQLFKSQQLPRSHPILNLKVFLELDLSTSHTHSHINTSIEGMDSLSTASARSDNQPQPQSFDTSLQNPLAEPAWRYVHSRLTPVVLAAGAPRAHLPLTDIFWHMPSSNQQWILPVFQ